MVCIKYRNNKYATIGSVFRFLMISADTGLFGSHCNVWPDPVLTSASTDNITRLAFLSACK
jgi:hypothetical protein